MINRMAPLSFPRMTVAGTMLAMQRLLDQIGTCWNCGGVGAIEFDSYWWEHCWIQENRQQPAKELWRENVDTCEETTTDDYIGKVDQVDPSGERPHELTSLGELEMDESFAFDESTLSFRHFQLEQPPSGA